MASKCSITDEKQGQLGKLKQRTLPIPEEFNNPLSMDSYKTLEDTLPEAVSYLYKDH